MARRAARSAGAEFGTLYRGRAQWSWLAHRVTGVGIILFLFAHVVDTALVGWGPDAYNRVVDVYHNPVIRLLELVLVAFVIYHALNGVRIMVIDFWPELCDRERELTVATMGLFVAGMIPITLIMVTPVFEKWVGPVPTWWPF